MIKQQKMDLKGFLQKAIDPNKENQLISFTEKINPVDMIDVFTAAKQLNKDRFFWSDHLQEFMLVGIGMSDEIIAEKNRFISARKQWKQIIKEAVIHDPYKVSGTGLLSFGGMDFDPLKKRTSLWHKFHPFHFVIPHYAIIKNKSDYFFTYTAQLKKNQSIHKIINTFKQDKELLFAKQSHQQKNIKIIKKEEIASDEWMKQVEKAIHAIKNKEAKKIVLARELRIHLKDKAEIAYALQYLLEKHHDSYIFAFEREGDCFLGATPERLLKFKDDQLLSTCLAGTAPRGKSDKEDEEMAFYLQTDAKNLEEHSYVVQRIRDVLEKYCDHIIMPQNPSIHTLNDLHHLYTPVSAQIKEGASVFDIIEELHPTPALGGTPKQTALRFIRDHEPLDRGWYGAPIGWLDSNHHGEFAVAIRSGLFQGDKASLFAGCGVMEDSIPQEEYEETMVKFMPMLSVMEDSYE